MTDWTNDIKAYGDDRGWKPLPTRHALKQFCEARGLERQKGIAADRALRHGYRALAIATPAERAACCDWQSVLELQARQRAAKEARHAEAHAKRQAELDALADSPGWVLTAGEETELIATGTRDQVRSKLHLVTHCPRDPYSGKGCWVIHAPDHPEAESGYFDADIYW